MKIGRVIAPVHSLGPGNRICLWTQGCRKHCKGCISPELQDEIGPDIDESVLSNILKTTAEINNCDRLTISGGDPFEQPDSLRSLLSLARPIFRDILVYTGYTYEDIIHGAVGENARNCLYDIDVLIDGPYIQALNQNRYVLRGSGNQNIIFLNEALRSEYEEYMKKGRFVECFSHDGSIIVTGIMEEKE